MKELQIFVYIVCISIVLKGGITPELQTQAKTLSDFVVFAWTLGFINLVYLKGALNQFGVCPRTTIGLFGIALAPFLHVSWHHLMGNTIPFIILGWFVLLRGITDFYIVTVVTILLSGLGIWMFGRDYTSNISASGIIRPLAKIARTGKMPIPHKS